MKGFVYIRIGLLIIIMASCLVMGFVVGAILKMDSAFDLGYKVAIDDIRQATKTAYRDKQPFFWLSNVPYKFNAISEKKVVINFVEGD